MFLHFFLPGGGRGGKADAHAKKKLNFYACASFFLPAGGEGGGGSRPFRLELKVLDKKLEQFY